MTDTELAPDQSPAGVAAALITARDRLMAFVETCDAAQWSACPLDGQGDPRSTGVIVDHVADAYGYIGGWISELVAGDTVDVNSALVDTLNAEHAQRSHGVTKDEVAERLRSSGDALAALIRSLSDEDLTRGDGRAGRLVNISLLHTDGHRRELEESLSASG